MKMTNQSFLKMNMVVSRTRIYVLLFIIVLTNVGVAKELNKTDKLAGIRLSIKKREISGHPAFAGWPVWLDFKMKNISDELLEFESLLLSIILEDDKGTKLEKVHSKKGRIISIPGHNIDSFWIDIAGYFELQPGQYNITVVCKTKNGSAAKSNVLGISVKRKLYEGNNQQVIKTLEKINPKSNRPGDRADAVLELAEIKDESIKPILQKLLQDEGRVRFNAARKLAELGDDSGIEILRDMLERKAAPISSSGVEFFDAFDAVSKLESLYCGPEKEWQEWWQENKDKFKRH